MRKLFLLVVIVMAAITASAQEVRGEKRNVSICGRPEND